MTNSALQYLCLPASVRSYSPLRPFGWLLLLMGMGCGMNLRGSEIAETEYTLPAVDYFPDHPVVQEMVEKAVRYLEKETTFTDLGYRERSFSRRSRFRKYGRIQAIRWFEPVWRRPIAWFRTSRTRSPQSLRSMIRPSLRCCFARWMRWPIELNSMSSTIF